MLTINGTDYPAQEFAWDGCHKIYLITTPEDRAKMEENGYTDPGDILPVSELPDIWENHLCSLRFISPADLSDDIVPQFADDPTIEYVADEPVKEDA